MAYTIYLEVPVTVSNEEQAQRLMQAVSDGLAEIAIKDRVLFGSIGVSEQAVHSTFVPSRKSQSGVNELQNTETLTHGDDSVVVAKRQESQVELQKITTKAPEKKLDVEVLKAKERSRGIMGRQRIERTGK